MSKYELKHAQRYAVESTKVYMMDFYKKKFPHFFENAIIETRPATSEDYYIPPSLATKCIVVTKTAFDEIGCKRLACFPLQGNSEPCEDQPVWVQLGTGYHLACQPSCKEQRDQIDTLWRKGECIALNPLKKIFAMNPENVFDKPARGHLHSGLDVGNDGDLKVNDRYCKVYGLKRKRDDCVRTTGQKISEAIVGKTIHRAIATTNLPPLVKRLPTEIPDYLKYTVPSRKTKRDIFEDPPELEDVLQDIAVEFVKDELIDLGAHSMKVMLKKKIPRMLSKITVQNIGAKIAMKELVKRTLKTAAIKIVVALGSAVTVVMFIYEIFTIVVDILDAIDPMDFNKVLTKSDLDVLNKSLDDEYYEESRKRGVLTPEDVWNRGILILDDESEIYEYMAERINEYLAELRPVQQDVNWMKFHRKPIKDWSQWKHGAIVLLVISIMVMYSSWIHIWSVLLLFALMYFKNFTM